ncbi:MAG: hypothetical protein Q9184_006090 [Pyrenodesmia sp. 2 TL-2023]
MESTTNHAFGEVVEELEAILTLHTDLQTTIQLQPLFDPEWFENKVRNKVHQLQLSTMNGSELETLKKLSRLAKLHKKLAEVGFGDFHEQIAMAVVRLKIFLNADVDAVKDTDTDIPVQGPYMMHGAVPPPHEISTGDKVFSIQAIGSTTHKFASTTTGLYLIWSKSRRVVECFQGRTSLTRTYPDFTIDPNSLTLFEDCKDNGKILLESSIGVQKEVPLFVHLTDKDDMDDFFEYLLELSQGTFKRQSVSSQKIDKHVAGCQVLDSMADYHSTLAELEGLVQTRVRLIARGSKHWGVEKAISATLSKLLDANSLPLRAEDYCRRLKIVSQQLGGYAMGDMDALISMQETFVGTAKPNTGRPRSPKFSPPPVIKATEKAKDAAAAKGPSPFAWNNPPSALTNAAKATSPFAWNKPPTAPPNPWAGSASTVATIQSAPPTTIAGAWPASDLQQAQPAVAPVYGQATFPEPPALHISILRMRGTDKGKHFKYRNKRSHAPCDIKIGGSHYVDDYSGFTHPLLAKPNKIGTIQWSQNSTLVILSSVDHVPHTHGNTVHIQAYSKEDAQSLVNHMRVWYANGVTQVIEIPRASINQSKPFVSQRGEGVERF